MARRKYTTNENSRYLPPAHILTTTLEELLGGVRPIPENQHGRLGITSGRRGGLLLWYSGDKTLVKSACVAVVGARKVSPTGAARARRLARELAQVGVVVVSGLATGVDTEALSTAIQAGGRTIGVIGTPLNKVYPASNARLQELIYKEHLLISQFRPGQRVFPSNFPERNKLMAAISDATVIIEASDTSGSLHQAAECIRLNRWLFIAKSVLDDRSLQWPSKFLPYPNTRPLTATEDILQALGAATHSHPSSSSP